MTNAEKIRRMTTDELQELLSAFECGDIDYACTFCDMCENGGNTLNLDCDGCLRRWLNSDADDYNGLNSHPLFRRQGASSDIIAARKCSSEAVKKKEGY